MERGKLMETIMKYVLIIPGLLSAIIPHELAHGYVAYLLGDNTAKDEGRLTLNPIKHLDPLGFISLLIFKFGWAKPVPVDSRNFKNRKVGIALVAAAGPLTNFILAIIIAFIMVNFNIRNVIVLLMLRSGLQYNVILGIFNLLPFPPLDGSKILASLLPEKWEYLFYKYERYFYLILFVLIMTNQVNKLIWPAIDWTMQSIINLVY